MATYKLIQDIEAEDHILGPLTLKQFLFALGAALFYYLCFVCLAKHVPYIMIIFLPIALLLSFFAFPFGKDQPTEVWALAKLHYFFKPRKRLWNQSGLKEVVTVTAPKKIERVLTDGLSKTEVKSRLKALANTIDSRGWAVKGEGIGYQYYQPGVYGEDSDRLINISPEPMQVQDYNANDDILDEQFNPVAQQFTSMINAEEVARRQRLINQMNSPSPVAVPAPTQDDYWFMRSTPSKIFTDLGVAPTVIDSSTVADDQTMSSGSITMPVVMGSDDQQVIASASVANQNPAPDLVSRAVAPARQQKKLVHKELDADMHNLAMSHSLSIASIQHEADKKQVRQKNSGSLGGSEVVINLHE